jgi:uncharacterized protein (DUF58 family)
MSPTPRVAVLLAACAVAAAVLPGLVAALAALVVLAVTVGDALVARRRAPQLVVEGPSIAPRGTAVPVSVRPATPEPALQMRLAGLPGVHVEDGEGRGTIDAQVTAARRGRHVLPRAVARRIGPLGLGRWDHRAEEQVELRVLPDYRAAHALASAVRSASGLRSRGPYGLGTEFDHVRDYAPEDDVRQVNWRATARMGRPMSNQRRVEADRDVMILVDTGRMGLAPADRDPGDPDAGPPDFGGPSWRFPTPERRRLARERRDAPPEPVPADVRLLDVWMDAAAAVAATADALDDHVGAIAYDDQIRRHLQPRRGAGHAVVRALHDLEPTGIDSDHERAFRAIGGTRRSFVLVLTDLLDETAAATLLAAAPIVSRRHALCIATIEEPRMRRLATAAPDDELGALAQAVAVDVRAQREAVAGRLAARGAQVITVAPGVLPAATVRAYLRAKRRGVL